MAGIDFVLGGDNELIEQVVGFDAETFAATDFNVGARFVFFAERVAEFGGTARRQRDHLVRKMGVVVGGFVVAESSQGFDDSILRLGLAGVDDVIDFGDVAEMRMIFFALDGRDPAVVLIRIAIKLAVTEIAAEQAKLPHVVCDVFADVADGAVGAHDYFLVFFGRLPWAGCLSADRSVQTLR